MSNDTDQPNVHKRLLDLYTNIGKRLQSNTLDPEDLANELQRIVEIPTVPYAFVRHVHVPHSLGTESADGLPATGSLTGAISARIYEVKTVRRYKRLHRKFGYILFQNGVDWRYSQIVAFCKKNPEVVVGAYNWFSTKEPDSPIMRVHVARDNGWISALPVKRDQVLDRLTLGEKIFCLGV